MGSDGKLAEKKAIPRGHRAVMDSLAASTHSNYFKRSHQAALNAVFYSRVTQAWLQFGAFVITCYNMHCCPLIFFFTSWGLNISHTRGHSWNSHFREELTTYCMLNQALKLYRSTLCLDFRFIPCYDVSVTDVKCVVQCLTETNLTKVSDARLKR